MIRLDSPTITNYSVRRALARGECDAAMQAALAEAARAVTDIGVSDLAAGRIEAAIGRFQQGLRLDPTCQSAFHNLVCALMNSGQLRGSNFDVVRSHLLTHWRDLSWRNDYRQLFSLPKFLNVEFVKGKCNLKCRMCIGTNSAAHPDRLTSISVEDFERMLAAAPTIAGVTLSSGDSDPLLHPNFVEILETAARRGVRVDLYTNGLPLTAKTARAIVSPGVVSMINFSIDAASATTYGAVRGGDFEKLISKIGMLAEIKSAAGAIQPLISFSFVAMRDNIDELPAFVDLGAQFGAGQIIVDDLSGWMENDGGNFPATDHSECAALLESALRIAADRGIRLTIHERLRRMLRSESAGESGLADGGIAAGAAASGSIAAHLHEVAAEVADRPSGDDLGLACCGWIDGVWVGANGKLHPCCMVQGAVDMGRVQDGPLHDNRKYRRAKEMLLTGRVFEACRSQRMCAYVQQQKAHKKPLVTIDACALHPPSQLVNKSNREMPLTESCDFALPILN